MCDIKCEYLLFFLIYNTNYNQFVETIWKWFICLSLIQKLLHNRNKNILLCKIILKKFKKIIWKIIVSFLKIQTCLFWESTHKYFKDCDGHARISELEKSFYDCLESTKYLKQYETSSFLTNYLLVFKVRNSKNKYTYLIYLSSIHYFSVK